MEYNWTAVINNTSSSSSTTTAGNGNGNNNKHAAWETWNGAVSREDWRYPSLHNNNNDNPTSFNYYSTPPSTGGLPEQHYILGRPHLTLGKRHYLAEEEAAAFSKKERSPAAVPRCQVEGCEAVLVNAKDYHRRHKVCEFHAKAPLVVLLGTKQRFCQQCSRFHAVEEFDDTKRSCRRRLAGHNERRRKSSQDQHIHSHKHTKDTKMSIGGVGRHYPHLVNSGECALSLLSSSTNYTASWNSPPSSDLPGRCSAALRELIAENRASLLGFRNPMISSTNQMNSSFNNVGKLKGSIRAGSNSQGGHVTLDLMRARNSTFGLVSVHDHDSSKEGDQQSRSDLWKLPLGY